MNQYYNVLEMSTPLVTYYTVLQLEEDADSSDSEFALKLRAQSVSDLTWVVRRAYLRLSLLCHPDRRPGDANATTAFQTIRGEPSWLTAVFYPPD